jgi:hypothetical protein
MLKNNGLDYNQDEEVCRPLMTFTRVFTQLMRIEEQCMGLKLQSTKKTNNNSEEGYKIQVVRCLFFKQKTDVKVEREETLAHKVTQQRRHRGKT